MTVQQIEDEGYTYLRFIQGKYYGLFRFIFTTGLVVGIDEVGYESRYCYKTYSEAKDALKVWDGVGDPPGDWIKQKGNGVDRSNPNKQIE